MSQKVFTANAKVTATVVMGVTDAAQTLHAISVRTSTQQRFTMNRHYGLAEGAHKLNEMMYGGQVIPITHMAMAAIIGDQLGNHFEDSETNAAHREYFALVNDRLLQLSLTLAYSREYWYLVSLPAAASHDTETAYAFSLNDLLDQRPNGFPKEV